MLITGFILALRKPYSISESFIFELIKNFSFSRVLTTLYGHQSREILWFRPHSTLRSSNSGRTSFTVLGQRYFLFFNRSAPPKFRYSRLFFCHDRYYIQGIIQILYTLYKILTQPNVRLTIYVTLHLETGYELINNIYQ